MTLVITNRMIVVLAEMNTTDIIAGIPAMVKDRGMEEEGEEEEEDRIEGVVR